MYEIKKHVTENNKQLIRIQQKVQWIGRLSCALRRKTRKVSNLMESFNRQVF